MEDCWIFLRISVEIFKQLVKVKLNKMDETGGIWGYTIRPCNLYGRVFWVRILQNCEICRRFSGDYTFTCNLYIL